MNYFITNGAATHSDVFDLARMSDFGRKMLARKVGGGMSRFIITSSIGALDSNGSRPVSMR